MMDRSLVERAQHGDRDAFSSVALELSDRLFAVAHRILRDFDMAGDALQLTLVRMWRDLPSLREVDRIEPWAYRVLLRVCQDELRRIRRRAPQLQLLRPNDVGDDPSGGVGDREQLDRAFSHLSAEHRAALVLHYYRDLTLPEIARVLEVPVGTVRSRLHYARRAMRSAIEADARPTSKASDRT